MKTKNTALFVIPFIALAALLATACGANSDIVSATETYNKAVESAISELEAAKDSASVVAGIEKFLGPEQKWHDELIKLYEKYPDLDTIYETNLADLNKKYEDLQEKLTRVFGEIEATYMDDEAVIGAMSKFYGIWADVGQ